MPVVSFEISNAISPIIPNFRVKSPQNFELRTLENAFLMHAVKIISFMTLSFSEFIGKVFKV